MKKLVYTADICSLVFGALFAVLYGIFHSGICFSLAVTFFATFYHITMRLVIGYAVNCIKAEKKPFKISEAEMRFYKIIKLRSWKGKVPTYKKEMFSFEKNSYDEIYRNMRNAQMGHEIMVLLSFVPLLFSKALDGFAPFLITSVLAAMFDMQFVFVQRYNRARLSKIIYKD